MKRRVLRTHANKRCLRILSASHQLRTPSSTDKAHAVLCDASFLRAVLLTYWQAQAPAQWRKARARQLNKAAAPHAAASQEEQKEEESKKEETEGDGPQQRQHKQERKQQRSGLPATVNAALLVARLPVPQMPALSPFDFLYALTHDAFHSNSSDASPAAMPTVSSAGSDRFIFHCLPETVAALHRMREPAAATSAGVEDSAPHQQQQQQQSSGSTPAWLAASLVSLEEVEKESALHRRTGAAAPLTFQELPAAVVDALLSRLHLLQDPSNDAVAQVHTAAPPPSSSSAASPSASSSSQQQQLRNEAKAIAVFMDFNSRCLAHGGSADTLNSTNGLLEKVRLCSMPRFGDVAAALGHHALKRQRQRLRGQSSAASARGGPVASRPFLPRTFFVATQSHDVRRLLPPTAALLRLTTKPDAIWIELRGQSYTYNDDHSSSSSSSNKHGSADVTTKRTRSPGSVSSSTAHSPPHRGQRSGATVMSAAPSLSRADVAFMKHLGTATHVPLPEKNAASAAAAAAAADAAVAAPQHPLSAGRGGGAAGGAARKRLRQRGQNPLSMKKKQKREVFRA